MSDLPLPLTPAEAELRNFREMPLDVPRLLNSDLAHDESPEACWSALLLWCVSWHEVPAGSLPDNDDWLAKRAGYWHKGKLDPTWHDVRAGALHGWIKCSDGRLYHPVVAEKVNHAWHQKHRHAHEKLCERIRKRNKVRAEKGQAPLEIPDFDHWLDAGRPLERELFPEELSTPSGGKDAEFRRKGGGLPPEDFGSDDGPTGKRGRGIAQRKLTESENEGSRGNSDRSGGKRDSSAGNEDRSQGVSNSSAGNPPENALNGAERSREEVNLLISGGGTAQAVTREDAPNAAAAFVEILRSSGVAVTDADDRIAAWPGRGFTPDDLRIAVATGRKRREDGKSDQPLNVGLLDRLLGDVLAARTAAASPGKPADDGVWYHSFSGIVAFGKGLGVTPREGEHPLEFKLRVFNAAGDGPWWDEHNRAFRNAAGPVAAGALLGAGR
ncbi:YdaU family protein [Burkholderia gladioli]|uniref:YdaU family protein n=1 Tax=Burkholderia gladioli TaxID=28095 RepID=UPI001FC7F5F3|nr:YdaU family protein [Burkholderia gladioli]